MTESRGRASFLKHFLQRQILMMILTIKTSFFPFFNGTVFYLIEAF